MRKNVRPVDLTEINLPRFRRYFRGQDTLEPRTKHGALIVSSITLGGGSIGQNRRKVRMINDGTHWMGDGLP
jgi:hypothetical protein